MRAKLVFAHISRTVYPASAVVKLSLGLDNRPPKRGSSFAPDVGMILQMNTTADRANVYRKVRSKQRWDPGCKFNATALFATINVFKN
jgi:hypothetical protein